MMHMKNSLVWPNSYVFAVRFAALILVYFSHRFGVDVGPFLRSSRGGFGMRGCEACVFGAKEAMFKKHCKTHGSGLIVAAQTDATFYKNNL